MSGSVAVMGCIYFNGWWLVDRLGHILHASYESCS